MDYTSLDHDRAIRRFCPAKSENGKKYRMKLRCVLLQQQIQLTMVLIFLFWKLGKSMNSSMTTTKKDSSPEDDEQVISYDLREEEGEASL
ncbi:hypothetical protein G4B88_011090 [Cannabis sativa]|uniref:Uncharacterized protein n=1 Tax=Cannabis sativa TaxID=3483 RepID=A0A7J6DNK5_CANSA|nr:hypothetical protein G4B88_011090 [Cannabis sativa]